VHERRFDLLVFDWDGTLVDSEARIVACLRLAMEDCDSRVDDDGPLRTVIGLGLPEVAATLLPSASAAVWSRFVACYRTHWFAPERAPAGLFSGAREVLGELRGRGYRLAVATGKSRAGLDRELRNTDLVDVFTSTRCADETRSKPHPQMLAELLAETGVSATRALMIGDTTFDLEMAAAASMAALAVGYGTHPPEQLLRLAALGCLTEIGALPGWLASYEAGG